MRLKKLSLVMALTLMVSAILLPITAYAGGAEDTTPPTLTTSLKGDTLNIESSDDISGVEAVFVNEKPIASLSDGKASVPLKDYAGSEKQVSIYARDFAGNCSEPVKLDNPYYKEPNSDENTSGIQDGAFTPEGTGTVQDNINGKDAEKQFYTITTDAGNIFYLVIDGKRDSNNVYFLNGVTESDLMALAEKDNGSMSGIPKEETCVCTEKCEAGNVNTNCPVCKNKLTGCTGKEKPVEADKTEEPEKPKKDNGSTGAIIFIIVALLAVSGIGYYVKIVRPKQQAEEDEEFEDDGYGEGFDPEEAYGEPEYLSEDDFGDKDGK